MLHSIAVIDIDTDTDACEDVILGSQDCAHEHSRPNRK